MASPDFPEPPPAVPATPLDKVDAAVARLHANAEKWVDTSIPRRIELLESCVVTTLEAAEGWVETARRAKGIPDGDQRIGEEWLGGPMTLVRNIRLLIDSLKEGGQPQIPRMEERPDGQKVAVVFPRNFTEKLIFTGFKGEVWLEPGAQPTQGRIYREKAAGQRPEGGVALVLGAGNVASIGPMDALYKLFVDDEVVICKTNPVNAYLGEYWEHSLKALVDEGFLEVVHGGAEVGAHLCEHDDVVSIHITGSDRTHDVIVWGADPEERERRMAEDDPKLDKPISSELGAVTPVMVVPGDWSEKDLVFQARHVAGMVANNGSFNCNAAKVLVVQKDWKHKERFLELVKEKLGNIPARKAYYPGAKDRYQGFLSNYPQAEALGQGGDDVVPWTVIPEVPAREGEYALTNEAFCGVLALVELDVPDAGAFIDRMVGFANDECWGTLSCMILIDPKTEKANKERFERAIGELRYGGIGVNVWAGVIYGAVSTTWGAFPGHTLKDIQSGRGVVHNTYLIDHPQKSVLRAPFNIFPLPVWFADHRNSIELGRRMTQFEAYPSLFKVPKVAFAALKG